MWRRQAANRGNCATNQLKRLLVREWSGQFPTPTPEHCDFETGKKGRFGGTGRETVVIPMLGWGRVPVATASEVAFEASTT
mmetsp:Transcript_44684/g.96067  ORF Transcript_44684/g.96067 Transcript_44684/m.96067 type:complete len:81 (+) Transcript_44684:289-531(+)